MAKLIYSALASLDGYIEDQNGSFAWAEPDEEVHAFVNDLERPFGTHLYGRRLYEVMKVWQEPEAVAGEPPHVRDFAEIWRAADKIVYSRTLADVSTPRTRLERVFDRDAVRQLKAEAERDLVIGGPELASEAIRAGLVDGYYLFLVPVAVGGGKPALPTGIRVELELLEERRFGNGTVFLRYASGPS